MLEKTGSLFESMCAGKQPYPSESAADAALRMAQRERVMRTCAGVQSYQCPFCGEWHLGHAHGKARKGRLRPLTHSENTRHA
jgi:hypothetical protein